MNVLINLMIICIFSLLIISTSLVVGIRIMSKYMIYRAPIFILIGLAWVGISLPWIPEALKLFFLLFNPNISAMSLLGLYLTINIMLSPLFLIIWVIAMNQLTSLKEIYEKGLLVATVLLTVLFEILIILFLFIDQSILYTEINMERYTVYWAIFIQLFQVFLLIIVLITGIYFAKESMGSDEAEVVLKGRFLLIAFISFAIGAFLDALFTINTIAGFILKIIGRIILLSSSIEFFIGFIMPEKIKKAYDL